jgi:glycosyltransferase involved in cell wall biosynthesis
VSLEAASMGARVVVGSRGSEHEYFGPAADYVNPADPASIRGAVLRALARGPRDRPDDLDRRLEKFTWRRHAEITLEAYGRAMRRSG